MERLFSQRLRVLQPDAGCMGLFRAIVTDVWRSTVAEARAASAELARHQQLLSERLDELERAFIWEKRIDRPTFERQRNKLREEQTLVDVSLHEARLEQLDVEGLLAFAEHVFTDAARLWSEARPAQAAPATCLLPPRNPI